LWNGYTQQKTTQVSADPKRDFKEANLLFGYSLRENNEVWCAAFHGTNSLGLFVNALYFIGDISQALPVRVLGVKFGGHLLSRIVHR
jgi:hypothetical protein